MASVFPRVVVRQMEPGGFFLPNEVDRTVHLAVQMEEVVDDLRQWHMLTRRALKGLPHVHSDRFLALVLGVGQCGTERIHRRLAVHVSKPNDLYSV